MPIPMVAVTPTPISPNEDKTSSFLENGEETCIPGSNNIRKTSRRQWSVQGEPRSLLKRLRSQLAEDGCPESQYLMAKALLDHKEDVNYKENCHQAIFWLTQASFQGSLLATELLQECLASGLGINEQNYLDVKRCLKMDHQEKLAQVAGKLLFSSLNEGNEFVTARRLEKKMSEIINEANEEEKDEEEEEISCKDRKNIENYLEERYGSKRHTESSLIEAAKSYIQGEVPQIHFKYYSPAEDCRYWKKVLRIHYSLLKYINSTLNSLLSYLVTFSYFLLIPSLTCGLLSIYFLSWSELLFISCYILWGTSFLTMASSAVTVMVKLQNQTLFYHWSLVFQHYSHELNPKQAADQYKKKYMQCYGTYLGSMFLYLSLLPLVSTNMQTLVLPPLIIISFLMCTSLFKPNLLYNSLSSFLYVFAHNPDWQIVFKNWLIQTLPVIEPYIIEESFTLFDVIYFHLNIGSIFHGLWLVSLIFVSFTLCISDILFHVLCVTWFHMTLVALNLEAAALIHVSFLFWFILIVLPQTLSFISIIVPAFLGSLCCFINGLNMVVCSFVFCGVIIFLWALSYMSRKSGSLFKAFIILLSMAFLFQKNTDSFSQFSSISSLNWEQFHNVCFPSKEAIPAALTVRNCNPLKGTVVQWQAFVKQVDVESVSNMAEIFVNIFPTVIQSHIRCSLGKPYSQCERELMKSDLEHQQCLLVRAVKGSQCSLDNWNSYQFKFTVSMESNFWKFNKNSEVILKGGSEFEQIAFNLSLNERISFIGSLEDGIGTSHPIISISSLDCEDCHSKKLYTNNNREIFNYSALAESFKSTFNFFFGPTLTI